MKNNVNNVYDAIIIGSGAAGLNAADELFRHGVGNIIVLTEGLTRGTTRNTGSDKQTYYKVATCGEPDSTDAMAKYLNECGCDGFHALTQAAFSLRCFYKLVYLGVTFPHNEYGEYLGYRTDGDPRPRASSCGPYTSRLMWEALYGQVKKNGTEIEEGRAVKLLAKDGRVYGVITENAGKLYTFKSNNIILAVGGAAGMYADSAYPKAQRGGLGLALREGAEAVDLDRRQFGLATPDIRWNLSGSYLQALPRVLAFENGKYKEICTEIGLPLRFAKGYNWPYNEKEPSSAFDRAVYAEQRKGNRVFLDYTTNPSGYSTDALGKEGAAYLNAAGALNGGTPCERLRLLNPGAYDFLYEHGLDAEKAYIPAAVCVQHCNGGLQTDKNYMTNVAGLYAVGECGGVFGKKRPGGSALNDTMVSSLAAAVRISSAIQPYSDTEFPTYEFTTGGSEALLRELMSRYAFIDSGKEELLSARRELEKLSGGDDFENLRLTALLTVETALCRLKATEGKRLTASVEDGTAKITERDVDMLPEREENFEKLLAKSKNNPKGY